MKTTFITMTVASLIAGAAHAQDGRMIRPALQSGSERMAIYALSDPDLPIGVRIQAGALSNARGYDLDGTFRKVTSDIGFSPVLSYDSDINGGVGKDSFTVGGLEFLFPEEVRRKEGVVVGGTLNGSVRYALGNQSVLDLAAWGTYVWSPKHDLGKFSAGLSACASHQIERDLYVSACAAYGRFITDLKDDESVVGEISVNKIVSSDTMIHDLSVGLSQAHAKDLEIGTSYDQLRLRFGGNTLFENGDVLGYQIVLGEKVPDEKVRTFGVSVNYAHTFENWTLVGGLGYDKYDGATWLGADVNEESYSASLRVIPKSGPEFGVSYIDTVSGSYLNDEKKVLFDVRYTF